VIPVIRANSPQSLVVVGTPSYSSRVDDVIGSHLDPAVYGNVAYALHFYASHTTHQGYMTLLGKAYCAGLPIFITEWGLSVADGGSDNDPSKFNWTWIKQWVNLMETLKLSWANWSISDKPESSAALNSGTPDNQIGNDSYLTVSGKYVKSLTYGLNVNGTHTDVQPTTYKCADTSALQTSGGADIENDVWLEGENTTTRQNAEPVLDMDATGDYYLAIATTGAKAKYWMKSSRDTLIVLQFVMRATGGAATFRYALSNGKTITVDVPKTEQWTLVEAPAMFNAGKQDFELDFTTVNGGVDFDYMGWRMADSADSVNWSLDKWSLTPNLEPLRTTGAFKVALAGDYFVVRPGVVGKLHILDLAGREYFITDVRQEMRVARASLPQGLLVFQLVGRDGSRRSTAMNNW